MTAPLRRRGCKTDSLRTEATAGHGIGTARSTMIEERADIYAFSSLSFGINVA
jgi:protease II